MSRRLNPAAEKAAANQQVIKSLLKLPGNRVCADCKRNKLPRWASWNLGIFICIRCSGIHRGMGTHISRVKSVDLDTWTDEQIQSMLKWGNSRANKYWESNLAPGHIPSEAKIENFVRTKYESKRWVMPGGMPDPATLDDSDEEDVPLRVVQQKLENRQPAAAAAAASSAPPPQKQQHVNLFDDEPLSQAEALSESSTVPPASAKPDTSKDAPSPTKPAKPTNGLFGADFFGMESPSSSRPASVNSNPSGSSRPDLNRSILSLYASAPKPQVKTHTANNPSFSSPLQSPAQQPPSAFADLNSAFGSLSFTAQNQPTQQTLASPTTSSPTMASPPKPSPFANLTAGMTKSAAAPQLSGSTSIGFFGDKKASSAASITTTTAKPAQASSALGDLFDFGSPASASTTTAAAPPLVSAQSQLHFDNNAWATAAPSLSPASTAWSTTNNGNNNMSTANAWSSSAASQDLFASGFGAAAPKQAQTTSSASNDDEWGTFSSGTTATTGTAVKAGAGFGDEDLFGNVWK